MELSVRARGTLMYRNVKSHFYELISKDRDPNTISKLSAKYQFCAIHTADNTDGEVTAGGYFFAGGYIFALHRH